jgi:hypothetical protein
VIQSSVVGETLTLGRFSEIKRKKLRLKKEPWQLKGQTSLFGHRDDKSPMEVSLKENMGHV